MSDESVVAVKSLPMMASDRPEDKTKETACREMLGNTTQKAEFLRKDEDKLKDV